MYDVEKKTMNIRDLDQWNFMEWTVIKRCTLLSDIIQVYS